MGPRSAPTAAVGKKQAPAAAEEDVGVGSGSSEDVAAVHVEKGGLASRASRQGPGGGASPDSLGFAAWEHWESFSFFLRGGVRRRHRGREVRSEE